MCNVQKLIFYEFELHHMPQKHPKIFILWKVMVQYSNQIVKIFAHVARTSMIRENQVCLKPWTPRQIWWVALKFDILQSSVVHYLHNLSKCIWSCCASHYQNIAKLLIHPCICIIILLVFYLFVCTLHLPTNHPQNQVRYSSSPSWPSVILFYISSLQPFSSVSWYILLHRFCFFRSNTVFNPEVIVLC